MQYKMFAASALSLLLLVTAPLARAAGDSPVEFHGSGFLTVAAGKVVGGSHDPGSDLGYKCPCYISDYAQGGVYESGSVRLAPDTKLGLQGTASLDNGRYSITAQAVMRGARKGKVDLEWLYGTFELSSEWTLQVGRKRLPLFLSSEVQDVGYALPWAHLPPQLYGWEIVNFNGASLTWRDNLSGNWLATVNGFFGDEKVRDSGYWKIYNGKDSRTETRWSGITGVEGKLSRGAWDLRGVYITSTTQDRIVSAGDAEFSAKARQRIYGVSVNYDDGTWLARGEALYINRKQDYGHDHAQLVMAGRRIGPWTAIASYSNYKQSMMDSMVPAEGHDTRSLALRYDWGRANAVKLQVDAWRDKSGAGFASQHGDARVVTVSYDRVF
jgi:hypothetical protein